MSTQLVNLDGISTITWDTFPVNKLVVDGTTNWMKVNDQAYVVGGKIWVSGVEKTITALDDSGAGSVTYVEAGSDVVLATTDSTLSVIDPTDPNQTPYQPGQTLYINGTTAKEVLSITNSTTITFTDQTTLDYANLGSTTISTTPTNSTLFYVGQTLYVGDDPRVVEVIVGSVIYFTDGTNVDSANLGTTTLSTSAPQGNLTPFDVNTTIGSQVTINIDNTTRTDAPNSTGFSGLPEDYGYRQGYVVGVVGNLIEIQGDNPHGSNGTSYYYTNGVLNTWYYDWSKSREWNFLTYGVNQIWSTAPYLSSWNDQASDATRHKVTRWINNTWQSGHKYVEAMNKGYIVTWTTGTIGSSGETAEIHHTSEEHLIGQYVGGPMRWVGTKAGHTPDIWTGIPTSNNYDLNIFVTEIEQNKITGRNLDGLIFTATFDPQTRTWTYA